jgi:GAF domain-containing protein
MYKMPANEIKRLEALFRFDVLDTKEEEVYDTITKLAASIMGTPMAFITFVGAEHVWNKSHYGADITTASREHSFCAHAILTPTVPMCVLDARLDDRFSTNPYVMNDPGVRFYYAAPLCTAGEEGIGSICAVDSIPRPEPTAFQVESLNALSRVTMHHLETRSFINEVHTEIKTLKEFSQTVKERADSYRDLNQKADAILEKIKNRK